MFCSDFIEMNMLLSPSFSLLPILDTFRIVIVLITKQFLEREKVDDVFQGDSLVTLVDWVNGLIKVLECRIIFTFGFVLNLNNFFRQLNAISFFEFLVHVNPHFQVSFASFLINHFGVIIPKLLELSFLKILIVYFLKAISDLHAILDN